jgi:hypothetical protein
MLDSKVVKIVCEAIICSNDKFNRTERLADDSERMGLKGSDLGDPNEAMVSWNGSCGSSAEDNVCSSVRQRNKCCSVVIAIPKEPPCSQ